MVLHWFRRPTPADLSHLHFVVYTRQGCHLCESALDKLRQWQGQQHFTLELADVDADPHLQTLYGDQVPVVTVNGKVRFKGCINLVLLKRLLDAEAGKQNAARD